MDYGIRISLPGFDVKTCDDKDLVMTSKYPCMKIVESGEVPFDFSQPINLTIGHSSEFPFIVLVYYYDPTVEAYRQIIDFTFDTSNIYISHYQPDFMSVQSNVTYFILYG